MLSEYPAQRRPAHVLYRTWREAPRSGVSMVAMLSPLLFSRRAGAPGQMAIQEKEGPLPRAAESASYFRVNTRDAVVSRTFRDANERPEPT
jgi:hypothetical protein